jgi:hypothetical protein
VTALGPGEIRARRRPALLLGVAALRLLAGFCLAWPLSSLIASSGVGLRAEGDRALFESGGYLLAEVLRLRGGELEAVARGLLPVFALGLLLTAAGNAALLVGVNWRGRLPPRELLSRASERLPALIVLGVGTALAQLVLLLAGGMLVAAIPEPIAKPVATTFAQAALWLAVALGLGALGGFSDLVKASLVRHESRLAEALSRALKCLGHLPIRATFGWIPYALCLLAAVAIAAKLTELCDVSRPGAWRLVLVFALHQAVIVVAVAARAAWFARALRLVATDV